MPVDYWLYAFLALMIVGAVITLEIKSVLSSIVALGIVGLLVSLSFLVLQAPDLALVQFIYEILILSIIIIIMTMTKNGHEAVQLRKRIFGTTVAALFLLPILYLGYLALKDLPVFGQPLLKTAARYLSEGAKETGSANLVTSVILDYRVYDTLGEATVIFAGILGAITIIRKIGRK